MPSAKALTEKKAVVEMLNAKMSNAVAGVLVDYKGITVADDTTLRRQLREAGVEYVVVKNTLLKRAAEAANLNGLDDALHGSTALAICDDYTAAAKVLSKYAEGSKTFKIKAGFMDGEVIGADKVDELAKLPSKEGLLSMLLSVLNGPIRGLAVGLNAIVEKSGEAAPVEEATEAPAEAPAEKIKVGMVTDVGGVNDKSFNQTSWEGLQALDTNQFEVKYLESKTDADYQTNINTFIDEGYDLIICVGYMLANATMEAAQANPDQLFAIIDDATCAELPNVACLMFAQEQASYLVGLVAGSVQCGIITIKRDLMGGTHDHIDGVCFFRMGMTHGHQTDDHDQRQQQGKKLFHCVVLLNFILEHCSGFLTQYNT